MLCQSADDTLTNFAHWSFILYWQWLNTILHKVLFWLSYSNSPKSLKLTWSTNGVVRPVKVRVDEVWRVTREVNLEAPWWTLISPGFPPGTQSLINLPRLGVRPNQSWRCPNGSTIWQSTEFKWIAYISNNQNISNNSVVFIHHTKKNLSHINHMELKNNAIKNIPWKFIKK